MDLEVHGEGPSGHPRCADVTQEESEPPARCTNALAEPISRQATDRDPNPAAPAQSSTDDSRRPNDDAIGCSICSKEFVRQCDLNKHFRAHNRPFKCAVATCKFRDRGWPTEKELQRHHNDKHSPSPRTFPCQYPPCSYSSKRESNCKQHMEKNHGWCYVRSRPPRPRAYLSIEGVSCPGAGGSRTVHSRPNNNDAAQLADTTPSPDRNHLRRPTHIEPDVEVLYESVQVCPSLAAPDTSTNGPVPSKTGLSNVGDSPLHGFGDVGATGKQSEVFLVWESPQTKFRKMQTVLDRLPTSLFTSGASKDSVGPLDHATVLNKKLLLPPAENASGRRRSPTPSPTCGDGPKPEDTDCEHATVSEPCDHGVSEAWPRSSAQLMSKRRINQAWHEDPNDDDGKSSDDEDQDDRPRKKKAKRSLEADFNDTEMECPFRLAHPEVYKRENDSRFSPCYTVHSQISTLVRHFKRAAHRLRVEDSYISSFDVLANGVVRHPAAGLCRRCWRPFTDRDEFERHVDRDCSRVSRSKREKYNLLHDTFCIALPENSSARADLAAAPTGNPSPPVANASVPVGGSPHLSHSPTWLSGVDAAAPDAESSRSLAQRVRALEQLTAQLYEMMTSMIDAASSRQIEGIQINPGGARGSGESRQADEAVSQKKRRGSHISDKESLVGGMDSRSTDVDRDGLIPEVNRTLSGMSSGSDWSTIRHVPHLEIQDLHGREGDGHAGGLGESSRIGHDYFISDSGFVSDGHGGGAAPVVDSAASVPGDETGNDMPVLLDSQGSQPLASFGQSGDDIPGEFFADAMSVYD